MDDQQGLESSPWAKFTWTDYAANQWKKLLNYAYTNGWLNKTG